MQFLYYYKLPYGCYLIQGILYNFRFGIPNYFRRHILNKNNHKYDLHVLLKFIENIQDLKKISDYKYIDLSVKNQIIVKEII